MKKFSYLTSAMVAIAVLSSCSREIGNTPNPTANGEATFTGISLALPVGLVTYAEDKGVGIAAEAKISTIGIYITEGDKLDYKVLAVNAENFDQKLVGDRVVYTSKTAVKTTVGMKKVYIVANPTAAIVTKLETSGAYAMNAAAFGIADGMFLSTASSSELTNMVMTGAYTGNGGVVDMTTALSEADAIAKPLAVSISRNLSKVVLQQSANYRVIGGTSTLTWGLINKAVDSYFLPQSSGTLYSVVPPTAVTDQAHAYWSNFYNLAETDYIKVLPYGTGDNKTAAYAESKYTFENLPSQLYEGNTTAARVKGVFTPAIVYGSISGGAPIAAEEFTTGSDFYQSNLEGTYWTLAGRNAAIAANYNGHADATAFTHYPGGVGYYTIWVSDGVNKGVKRGSYYLMQVTEVRGPGTPAKPETPTVPVLGDTYISVSITVLNWDFNKSEHILK